PRADAVLDGIFDERLKNKVGHERVQRVGLDLEHYGQTVTESGLFDLQVLGQEIQLFLQRDFLDADHPEGDAEQVAEAGDHGVGRLDIAVHERRDRVERIEEEVRLQLPLERLEPR